MLDVIETIPCKPAEKEELKLVQQMDVAKWQMAKQVKPRLGYRSMRNRGSISPKLFNYRRWLEIRTIFPEVKLDTIEIC